MSASHDQIVESLQELGLSLYETRLYLGLLTGGRQNGNELSRTSGVPSSKVYPMLERLANDGIVARTRRGSTVEYVCVPPRDLLHKLRERYAKPLEHLEATLPLLGMTEPHPDILEVQGVDAILDHARALTRSAEREIYLSVWSDEVSSLREDLEEADARDVRIAGMLYGVDPPQVGWWQQHSYRETVASRIGGRMLTLVVDGAEALIAHIPDSGEASAVRTRSPVLTLVAEEYLIHELTLQRTKVWAGYDEYDKWLRADEKLRKLTLGRTGHLSSIDPNANGQVVP
jgi:HTH-type transcriptional regulator, sugar sensing transcriptional regulator